MVFDFSSKDLTIAQTQNALPDKPSELIRVALSDLEKTEADDRYEVHIEEWFTLYAYCQPRWIRKPRSTLISF